MKRKLRYFFLLFLALAGMAQQASAFSDIKVDLMNGNLTTADEQVAWQQLPDIGIAVAEDGTVSRVAADAENAVAVLSGKWHSNEHGWAGFKAVVPVKGAVKISMGTCAWGGDVTVKNAEGETVSTFNTNTGACYHNDKENNIVSIYYKGFATTLTIEGGNYTPYFAVEPVAEWEIPNDIKVTFALGNSGAEGTLPTDQSVEIGSKLVIPHNHTLYVEGKTLTAWTDGTNLYAPDEEVEFKEDTELTPVFTTNSKNLGDQTASIELVWQLGKKNNGKTTYKFEGNTGFIVTQTTISGQTIDVKMDIDATSGKLNNAGRGDEWAQVNNGTKLTVPSAKNAVVEMKAYNAIAATTINGKTNYTSDKTISATIEEESATAEIVINDGAYYSYVKVTLPAAKEAEPTGWQDIYVNLVGPMLKTNERTEGVELEFGVAIAEDGTQTRVAANDPSANAVVRGAFHDDSHGWTKSQITVKVDGPVVIGVGNCQYGNQDAYYTDAEGNRTDFQTAKNCFNSNNVAETTTYVKYNGGPTTLTIHGASYCPYFSIVAVKTSWDDEAATATFPFNLGIEDQKADFGDSDEAFLSSKVMHGSTLTINGTQTHGDIVETTFQSAESNEADPNDGNAIKFIIRPYPGLVFTPSKVSFRATRFGTDSGKLDIAWLNPDGTVISLATAQSLNRNNTASPSNFSYVLTGATPGEGECGLLLNLYNVYEGKSMGFGNIVIEGTLKGNKQEIPVLATVTANGITYDVEKTFEIVGDDYVATIELFSTDKMISAENPVTIEVKEGTLGTITYEGDDQKTTVTIPVTHNDMTMKWVANFVRKPFYTLTFLDADGKTVLGTQTIEKDQKVETFVVSADKVTVADGYKFRGWTTQLAGLNTVKCSASSTFQADTKLFPFITAIELANATARYDYDLTNVNFDPADHDVLLFEGSGYWHDKQHGWAFNKGDKIKLNMGGKGYVKLNLCQYSSAGDITLYAPDGKTVLGTCANKAEADGGSASIQYDGEQGAGWLTLEIPAVSYIHSISIRNQAQDPYIHEEGSNFYVVKQGTTATENGTNLLSMLELANGLSGTERAIIFLPNGTYDLGETVLTAISRNNLSLVGQSMEGTIIKNAPDKSIEGIGTTATLVNTSTGLYLQDLTLQNALDYYGAVGGGQVGGRAVCLWDKGKHTISKNVRMLSYQDTYYSNSNSQFYWETSEIHGTVDYLCGGGDVFYEKVKFVNESRALSGKSGSDVIAAPYTDSSSKFGYVFNNCEIENLAASFSLGRSWGGLSKLTYLNTTINQPDEIIDSRFTLSGMNVAAYSFKEYNSKDTQGNVVTPASLVETFTHGNGDYTYDIVLSAEEAAAYTLDKVFTDWTPQYDASQVAAPADAKYAAGSVTWMPADNGATAYALFKNGELAGITTGNSFAIAIDESKDELTIRAANKMGGFGTKTFVSGTNGISALEVGQQEKGLIYNLSGQRVDENYKGIVIKNGKKTFQK